jgi:polysaccharide biosynthesis transport protein
VNVSPGDSVHSEQTLWDYVAVLRQHKWVILLAVVLVPVVAYTMSARQEKRYSAASEVLLNRQDLGAALTGVPSASAFTDPERFAQTNATLARVPEVARRAIQIAGVGPMYPYQLLERSSVSSQENADILRFNVVGTNPEETAKLATAYGEAFTRYRLEMDTKSLADARRDLEERLAELRAQGADDTAVYRSLAQKAQDLRTVELLQARAKMIRPALTAGQIAPTPRRSAVLGGLLGLLLGVGIAFGWNALDRRVRSSEEVEHALGIPLLARLPEPPRGQQIAMLRDPNGVHAESVRHLRTGIELSNLDIGAKIIMVTSPAAVQGKSTTIANLGVALARSGHSVVLVDLDLRQPMLGSLFDIGTSVGITDVVLGRVPLDQAFVSVRIPTPGASLPAMSGTPHGRLQVLPGGSVPPSPGEFVGTQGLARILGQLREENDYVLVDAPPLLAVDDAMTISTRVDAMFVIVRLGHTDRQMLRDFGRLLQATPAHKFGFVVTGMETRETYGGLNYGYFRNRPPQHEPTVLREVDPPRVAKTSRR